MLSSEMDELIGLFLAYPDSFAEYASKLHVTLFPMHEQLYSIMRDVHREEGLTYRGVISRVPTEHVQYVAGLRSLAFNDKRIPILLQKAKQDHLRRELKRTGMELSADAEDADPDELLRGLQEKAFDLRTTDSGDDHDPEKDLDDFMDYVDMVHEDPSTAFGILTGINPIDKLTMGWQRQDFSVIGARTSMGKSAFMLQNVMDLHKQGYKAAIYSLEMSKRQIYMRMMASLMNVAINDIRFGRLPPAQKAIMKTRKEELRGIYIDDTRGVDSEYIADSMRRRKRKHGLDFVVVDYLQDVKEKGEHNDNGGSAIARVCRKLRKAAQECDCHLMGLSQVTRAVEDRQNKRPGNSDLAGSTGIETSADVIAFLYRDEYYNPETDKKGILEVNFTKQRNGELGSVELHYNKQTQRIMALGN